VCVIHGRGERGAFGKVRGLKSPDGLSANVQTWASRIAAVSGAADATIRGSLEGLAK
jgi:hypothetical protein